MFLLPLNKAVHSKGAIERLEYFYENSNEVNGCLNLSECEINDEKLNEIIIKWIIDKKLLDNIRELEYVYYYFTFWLEKLNLCQGYLN